MKLEHSPLFFFFCERKINEKKSGKIYGEKAWRALGSGHRARIQWPARRRRKGMAERQENGRLKESAGFPLDVKAPIEAVAQRACTPDNDGSRGNAFYVVPRILSTETDQIFIDISFNTR